MSPRQWPGVYSSVRKGGLCRITLTRCAALSRRRDEYTQISPRPRLAEIYRAFKSGSASLMQGASPARTAGQTYAKII